VGEYSELIWQLLLFFGLFVSAGLGAPFPEELLIVGAGVWTAQMWDVYPLSRWLMLPVCITGVIIADVFLYGIGLRFGTKLLEYKWTARFFPKEKRKRIERNFDRHGVNILIFGRLLPGIRMPLFLTAGIMRLPFARFLIADGIGAVVGNSILFFLAWWFGDQFRALVQTAEDKLKPILILVVIALVVAYLVYHFVRTPMPTGDPEELPPIIKQVAIGFDSVEARILKHSLAEKHTANNVAAEPPPKEKDAAAKEGTESK
jgi:membrane protein DedA with SNARE-associated domain